MWVVVYADSSQVVAVRRTEAAARRVAETRKSGGQLDVTPAPEKTSERTRPEERHRG